MCCVCVCGGGGGCGGEGGGVDEVLGCGGSVEGPI